MKSSNVGDKVKVKIMNENESIDDEVHSFNLNLQVGVAEIVVH
jgi:hypothetical protein